MLSLHATLTDRRCQTKVLRTNTRYAQAKQNYDTVNQRSTRVSAEYSPMRYTPLILLIVLLSFLAGHFWAEVTEGHCSRSLLPWPFSAVTEVVQAYRTLAFDHAFAVSLSRKAGVPLLHDSTRTTEGLLACLVPVTLAAFGAMSKTKAYYLWTMLSHPHFEEVNKREKPDEFTTPIQQRTMPRKDYSPTLPGESSPET